MASAKGGVHVLKLRPPDIPEILCKGERFFKFDDTGSGCFVILRVDPKGHIVYWANNATDSTTEHLDFSSIIDVRYGKYATIPRDIDQARSQFAGSFVIPASSFDSSFLTIVSGNNTFVEERLIFYSFLAPSPDVAENFGEAIFKISRNLLSINGSALSYLNRSYAKIRYGTTSTSQIRCKDIIKLFAGNRDEKKSVEKALQAAHIPCGKNDSVPLEKLTEDSFFNFYRCLTSRNEVGKIFAEIQSPSSPQGKKPSKSSHSGDPTITVAQFVKFLNEEQRDPRLNEILYPYYTVESAQRLINQYEPNKETARKGLITIDGFLRYLLSEDNGVLAEEMFDLRVEDTHEPLAHYFINSSHNTYLTGHQYRSKSSVEMYRQALLVGCRSIELDCWDGKNDEPVITHGPAALTMVTLILFKDVIEAIAESAFKTSEYPVILSFENHCSNKQQEKMAKYCREIFGEMLLKEPIASYPLEPGVPLPSPHALKRKIIIKNKKIDMVSSQSYVGSRDASLRVKKPKSSLTQVPISLDDSATSQSLSSATAAAAAAASQKSEFSASTSVDTLAEEPVRQGSDATERPGTSATTNGEVEQDGPSSNDDPSSTGPGGEGDDGEDGDDDDVVDLAQDEDSVDLPLGQIELSRKEMKTEVGRELSELVNYMQAKGRFKSFDDADKRNMSSELFSLVEVRALSLLSSSSIKFVNHNKRQITRVYPKGTRVDSSNYIPQAFWNAGCQMVALNFQTLDLGMQLNLGVFEMNGRTGYILKPECMTKRDRHFDPFETESVENTVVNTVRIRIISGQLLSTLSDRKLSTFVEAEMYGLATDTVRRKFRTKTAQNNGINPTYENGVFEFRKIVLPDLATLRIVVNDESGKMLGHRILPVVGIRPGYRHIILRNAANQSLGPASLFVKIDVKDFVPDAHVDVVEALADPIAAVARLDYFANALVNPIAHRAEKELERHQEMLKSLIDDDDTTAAKMAKEAKRHLAENGPSLAAVPSAPKGKPPSNSDVTDTMARDKLTSRIGAQGSDSSVPCSPPVPPGVLQGKKTRTESPGSQNSPGSSRRKLFLIDSYQFKIPSTSEELLADKKMEKLKKKQEKDLEILKLKHSKELDRLKKKHIKRITELELSQSPRSHSLLERATQMSLLKRVERTSHDGEMGKVMNKQGSVRENKELSKEQQLEIAKAKEEQEKELRNACSMQWKEEKGLLEDQEVQNRDTLISLLDQIEKKILNTLEGIYKRECQELMKKTLEDRKLEIAKLSKDSTLDDVTRQKEEVKHKSFAATMDQRKKMANSKTKRQEEISRTFEQLKERLTTSHEEKMGNLTAEYSEKIKRGDLPVEITSL